MVKPLIDTNVCLDLLLKRKSFILEAGVIFQRAEHRIIKATVSAISIDTLAYFMRSDFNIYETTEKLQDFISIISIGTVNKKIIENALNAGWKDVEDAIQYYCAKENGCDCIITRNTKDFIKSSLPVYTPFEFLEHSKFEAL